MRLDGNLLGFPCLRLQGPCVRIGPLADRSLSPGEWRVLTSAEVRTLYAAAQECGAGIEPVIGGESLAETAGTDPGSSEGPG